MLGRLPRVYKFRRSTVCAVDLVRKGSLLDDVGTEPLSGDATGGTVLLHFVERFLKLCMQLGVLQVYTHAVVFSTEVVFEHTVFALALVSQITTHDFIEHDGIQTAGGQ